MAQRLPYQVFGGSENGCFARFARMLDALRFAQQFSDYYRNSTEVMGPDGLVGQYDRGTPTPEFLDHHRLAFSGA